MKYSRLEEGAKGDVISSRRCALLPPCLRQISMQAAAPQRLYICLAACIQITAFFFLEAVATVFPLFGVSFRVQGLGPAFTAAAHVPAGVRAAVLRPPVGALYNNNVSRAAAKSEASRRYRCVASNVISNRCTCFQTVSCLMPVEQLLHLKKNIYIETALH